MLRFHTTHTQGKHNTDNNLRESWLVCLSSGLFFFYVFLQMNIFDVINQPLRQAFHINASQLSWMSSAFVWASIIFYIPAGIMVDRFSVRKIILVTMTICIIGTLGFALTTSYILAVIFHALTGIANAFCFSSCMVLAARFFPAQHQALVAGCLVTMAFCGGMVAHTPLAYINAYLGWRTSILLDAILGVLILLWLFFVITDKFNPENSGRDVLPLVKVLTLVLRTKQNWLAGIYIACLNLPIMVLCALWGSDYLNKVHNLANIQASNIMSLILIGSMLGGPLFGFYSDKLGRRKPIMLLGAIGSLCTMQLLMLVTNSSYSALSCIFFTIGLFSSSQIIAYPLIAESNGAKNTGIAIAIASIIITGLGGFAQVLFGILLQYHAGVMEQHFVSADFQYAIIMLPIAAAIACFILLGMDETYCSRQLVRNTHSRVIKLHLSYL
jgi:MFS family permease